MAAPKFQPPRHPPRTVSPVLRELFTEMRSRRKHITDVAAEMNMTSVGLAYWKGGQTTPSITSVEALAQILGYRLVLEPIKDQPNG